MRPKITIFIFLFFFLLNISFVYAQVNGAITYKTILETENFEAVESQLILKENKSLFTFAYDINEKDELREADLNTDDISDPELSIVIKNPLSNYRRVFIDRINKEIYSTNYFFKNRKSNKCTIKESTGNIDWEIISDNSKKIGDFTTYEAKTSFRGRNYTAWFTTEIPIDAGPWKFHGLPGLILEVTDEEMGVQFYATSVEVPLKYDFEIEAPNEGVNMTIGEYAGHKDNFKDELIALILSKLPRGATASYSVNSSVSRSIEREF